MKAKKRGRPKKHPRDKPGWNSNPYGKYPIASQIKKFNEETSGYYAEKTQKERRRKITRICNRIVELGAPNNALKWQKKDILRWKDDIDITLDNATRRKYWRILRDFLNFYDVKIVERMFFRKEIRMPRSPPKEITTLDEKIIWKIHRATYDMVGWEGDIARFLTVAYPFTGLRPSELRTIYFADVNQDDWTLKVSNPKGADLYGVKRTVGIPPVIKMEFTRFIEARRRYLDSEGMDESFQWLIPYKGRNGLTHWPEGNWNDIKRSVTAFSGIYFKWKDYRSSFCQLAIDKGANLQAVSKVMGHKTSATTESYYGRIRDLDAIKEIDRVLG